MPVIIGGPRKWSMSRDEEGHRSYKITFRVMMDSPLQGPAAALQTPGLPVFGTYWIIDDEVDLWAWCRWDAEVEAEIEDEPNLFFSITFTFSTKPPDKDERACKETQVEDPLLEPPKINGSFVTYSEEAVTDRFGNPILNSAFERLRGPQVEFDANRPQIKIEINVPALDLALLGSLANTVNDAPLWGFPPRCVKLSEIEWERRYYGQCYVYYTLHLTFDVRYDTFDRDLLDEATKVLNGQWDAASGAWNLLPINGQPPNYQNPQHFIKFPDRLGNPMKGILNGAGVPAGVQVGTGTQGSGNVWYFSNIMGNQNQQPPGANWISLIANDIQTSPDQYDPTATYQPGQSVANEEDNVPNAYVCRLANTKGIAPDPNQTTANWLRIPAPYVLSNKGIWNSKTVYNLGDFVFLKGSTVEGVLHIEKYPEADPTILGIPLVL